MTLSELRKALKISILQGQKQRISFLTIFTKLQERITSNNVQLPDNLTHEEKLEDTFNITSNNSQPIDISGEIDSRIDVDRIIGKFLEDPV